MSSSASLAQLAERLLQCTREIETYQIETYQRLPESTGKPLAPANARADLLELTHELQVRVQSPSEFLERCQMQYQTFSCLRWLLTFDIFVLVPLDSSPISYADLARAAAVPLPRLRSVTRMAMTSGLFAEPSPGLVSHSALSMAMAKDAALRDWSTFITHYGAPSAACLAEATRKWGDSTAKNETAFNVSEDTTLAFFDFVARRPGMADEFSRYMQSQGRSEGTRLEHLVAGYDWSRLGDRAHVVDVGGSTGFTALALARANPGFTFTVQDLPEAIASSSSSSATLVDLDPQVAARLQFVAHDFFDPQPVLQGSPPVDAYLLRKILHDWPDSGARRILCRLGAAIEASGRLGARIIIMDTILPPPGSTGRIQEAGLRVRDLVMAQNFNSKERELGEWEELFASVVPKLRLFGWKQPPGSVMAVLDVGLAGSS
ncbi:O-methyltransferase [Apiospora sp. TS-2023a]